VDKSTYGMVCVRVTTLLATTPFSVCILDEISFFFSFFDIFAMKWT